MFRGSRLHLYDFGEGERVLYKVPRGVFRQCMEDRFLASESGAPRKLDAQTGAFRLGPFSVASVGFWRPGSLFEKHPRSPLADSVLGNACNVLLVC